MNLATLLPRHARYRPHHTAVIFGDQRLSYAELHVRVNRWANALLALGVGKGDKVATILPNCLEQYETYWATAAIGAVVVPLSPLLRGTGLVRLLNDSDAAVVLTDSHFAEHLDPHRADLPQVRHYISADNPQSAFRIPQSPYLHYHELTAVASPASPPPVAISGDDPYNIIYSSGTTGLPKGIIHTHAIRAAYCTIFAASYRITPESVILHTGSLVFNGAFLTLMPAMFVGATFILHPQFDAEAMIETVARERVTHTKMVPSQIIAMLNAPNFDPARLQSLEMIGSVGAPLHLEHKEALNAALPNRFYELYGLTEGFMTILDKHDYEAKKSSVGCPTPFMEMRIVGEDGRDLPPHQVGEIVGRGPMLMPGYYKRPDLTALAIRDGWLYSGDLGYTDEDGFLYLVDRQKDLIISGGVNVYPRDIEEILVQHPAVAEAAVFGIPDDKWGETPMAAVVLHRGAQATAEEIRAWANERVEARYQKLTTIELRDAFPRSVSGKTLKRVMREAYWGNS